MNTLVEKDSGYEVFNSLLQVPEFVYKSFVPELIGINKNYRPVNNLFFFSGKTDVWDKEPLPAFSRKTEP